MPIVRKILKSLAKYLRIKKKRKKKQKRKKRPIKRKRSKGKPKKTTRKRTPPKKVKKSSEKRAVRPKKSKPKIPKKKKALSAKGAKKEDAIKGPKEECIGEVTHYFSKIRVIVLKMTRGQLMVGETIHLKGRVTDFIQKVQSLQIESVDVKAVKKGQLAGLKVSKKAKVGDKVYKPVK